MPLPSRHPRRSPVHFATARAAGPIRARLAQRLDRLQRCLAACRTFDDPGAAETADRIAAVALAIDKLDALIHQDARS